MLRDEYPHLKVCSAQITSVWEKPEQTLKKTVSFICQAADSGAALICFPEQFATGWDPLSREHIQDSNGHIVSTLQEFARRYSIAILGSFREKFDPFPKNTAVAIGDDGRILATYAKMHLFSPAHEHEAYTGGTGLGIFSLNSLKFGIAICYDLRFPSLFRIYARQGVDAVFVPAAWPQNRIKHWELFIAARAAENQMYVLGVNTTGTTPVDKYSGLSMIADPSGTIICRAGEEEQIILTDLDKSLVETARNKFPVENDRKDALYHILLNEHS